VLVGASILITLVSAGIGVGQTSLTTSLGNEVTPDLRDRLFAHLQRVASAFFTSTRTGEIQGRLGNVVAGDPALLAFTLKRPVDADLPPLRPGRRPRRHRC